MPVLARRIRITGLHICPLLQVHQRLEPIVIPAARKRRGLQPHQHHHLEGNGTHRNQRTEGYTGALLPLGVAYLLQLRLQYLREGRRRDLHRRSLRRLLCQRVHDPLHGVTLLGELPAGEPGAKPAAHRFDPGRNGPATVAVAEDPHCPRDRIQRPHRGCQIPRLHPAGNLRRRTLRERLGPRAGQQAKRHPLDARLHAHTTTDIVHPRLTVILIETPTGARCREPSRRQLRDIIRQTPGLRDRAERQPAMTEGRIKAPRRSLQKQAQCSRYRPLLAARIGHHDVGNGRHLSRSGRQTDTCKNLPDQRRKIGQPRAHHNHLIRGDIVLG